MEREAGPIVHRLARALSTQLIARDLLDRRLADVAHAVVADEQTAGRGRHGRSWLSPTGGLYVTFIVPNDGLIALRAGLATARAVEALSIPVRLKWPNDLIVAERKLGGILIETARDVALVGVGINLEESPIDGATSLRDEGVRGDRDAFVRAIYCELVRPQTEDVVLAAYRERSATLGRTVSVDRGQGRVMLGRAVDVDPFGHLVVETVDGRVTVASGDCLHLRETCLSSQETGNHIPGQSL
ncbi:MAG: biotin--[acetyl-CoA-carboxylase] ligase [Candidatus Bipolaricaulota bacterium]|nr:biotin--[acetyl-CoA-carboxylase] ligase [Candidatus Bipolaricaulota bacterium]